MDQNNLKNALWTEKYRPKSVSEYIFQDHRQRAQVMQMINEKSIPHILMSGVQGSGKAQPLTAKIHTPTGWSVMGELKLGEEVTTPSGDIGEIIGIFPQGHTDIYTITFHDGAKTDCCLDHLWECYYVDSYSNRTATKHIVDTKTIMEYIDKQAQRKSEQFKVSIPLITPIEYTTNIPLNIPPYILGVLLDDGSICEPSPQITSVDQEILDKVSGLLLEDYLIKTVSNTKKEHIISQLNPINYGGKIGISENYYTHNLKNYNVYGKRSYEKSIPLDYLTSSIENRLELIRGLFDTDGTVGKKGNVSYNTTSSILSTQIQEIIWSLGGICTITSRTPTYKYKGENKQGRIAYTLHITHPTPYILFSLTRKTERCKQSFALNHSKGNTTLRRRVKSIEYKGKELAQCIMIDHPDHLYVTDDYIVTHNTSLALILIDAMNLHETDVRIINASDENSVDTVRDKIKDFVSTAPMGPFKIILLEEADYITPNGQAVMRRLMEEFSDTARFILTCVTGGTKVYSPYGYSLIGETTPDQQFLSNKNTLLQNKHTKRSITTSIIELTTLHNQTIKSTPEHTFLTVTGPVIANNLKEDDNILINIRAMYGNCFQYEQCVDFFDVNNFKHWLLTEKSLPLLDEIEFLSNNQCFVFNNSHKKIYDWIINNNITQIDIDNISQFVPDINNNQARNFINKIKQFLTPTTRKRGSYIEYNIQNIFFSEYNKFVVKYVELFNKPYTEKCYDTLRQRTTAISVNSIVDSLNVDFTDDKILSMGRLIGMLHGNGHLSTNIHFAANNKHTLSKIVEDLNKFKPVEVNIVKNGNKSKGLCICFNDIALKLLFEYFGAAIGNKTKQYRRIPKWCEFKLFSKGFLQGLFDADATWCLVDKTNNKTISPIILNQHFLLETTDETFTNDIVCLLNKFNISSTIRTTLPQTTSGFGSHLTDRIIKQVQILKQEDIKQYLLCIGNYYDKPTSDDILGYLIYKENQSGYFFDTFVEWKQKYYIDGYINDKILNTNKQNVDNVWVYDCCFENYHWYITNGFVSHNCNYIHKIIPAIRSRCTTKFHFKAADKDDIAEYLINILATEQINFTLELLDKYIAAGYPDVRTILGALQQHTVGGKLFPPPEGDVSADDYKFKLIEFIESDRWIDARKLICANVLKEEYDDVYRFLYDNLHKSPKFQAKDNWEEAIVLVAQYLYRHTSVADPEINMAALCIELGNI